MSEPVATLTVDGDPDDYMEGDMWAFTVRIDGDLPNVVPHARSNIRRPLRVDDRVWLATKRQALDMPDDVPAGHVRFATATVAEMWAGYHGSTVSYVTVTDVEELS